MRKLEIKVRIAEEKNLEVNTNEFNNLLSLMDAGEALMTIELLNAPKTIDEYRAQYFAMRDIVADSTGNSKKDIHAWAKSSYVPTAIENTTKYLTESGWNDFIKHFKSWAFETLNIYL